VGAFGPYLRRATDGYTHWCPACVEPHWIGDRWKFNGDRDKPTFAPSVKITGKQIVVENGKWTGEWKLGPDGKALPYCCHYFLQDGQLRFCSDCTHSYAGKVVGLPPWPPGFFSD